jgi:hypothetical protein
MVLPSKRSASRRPLVALATGLGVTLLGAVTASADEPRSATEPRVMMESGEVTNVIDAFDDGDPFDLSVSLGFEYSTKSARIKRETHIYQPGLTTGGFTSNLLNVADYSETTTKLVPRVDVGLYKDLALYFKLPIILNNSRILEDLNGSAQTAAVALQGAPGETLFTLPFESPDRSGLEHIAVGLELDILNQARDRTKPTWLFGFEGRFTAGTPMHACNPKAVSPEVQCADPSDFHRDGRKDDPRDGADVAERDPGVTRGTVALELHTLLSKRIKYVEPYGGFAALFEFQNESSDYGITDLDASLVNHPPFQGTMTLGMMIIPWENREKFGRLTFDLRFTGTYRSEGRDYTELYDALGSSNAPSLRNPNWAEYKANPRPAGPGEPQPPRSVIDESSQKTYFTGLGDVQAFGSYRGSASVTWQASEYVKFNFGIGYRHDQGHGIGGDQPCNPDFKDKPIEQSGPCHRGDETQGQTITSTGIPNPNYRPTINAVGRRFYVDDSNTFDLFASGVVMF